MVFYWFRQDGEHVLHLGEGPEAGTTPIHSFNIDRRVTKLTMSGLFDDVNYMYGMYTTIFF